MSKDAVQIPDAAVWAVAGQFDSLSSRHARTALERAAPIIVAGVLNDLLIALQGHWELYQAMGDFEGARGVKRAIDHLAAYKDCVEDTEGEPA